MKTKFNLDRDKPTSDFIHSQQNFKKVLQGYHALKPPIWKNPWFYGPVGLASLAFIFIFLFQNQLNAHDEKSTLKLTSKNPLPEDSPCIQPINSENDVPFQIATVYPEKGKVITLASGTIVTIPANVLKSAANEPVEIKIREFRDKESAFLAGIPMDYGDDHAFESAGMLEIRAEKNGESVALKEGKELEVSMMLSKSPDGFQFWKLNEENSKWIETPCIFSGAKPVSPNGNIESKTVEQEIKKLEANKVGFEKQMQSLEKKSRTIQESKALLPTQNSRKLIIEYNANEFPELKGYKDVEWEYLLPENASEANLEAFKKRINYAQSQEWYDVDIKKMPKHYNAIFNNNKEEFVLAVKPVLKGKSLKELESQLTKAESEKRNYLAELKAAKLKFEKEEKALRLAQEKLLEAQKAELSRKVTPFTETNNSPTANFRPTGFGVYNCDKPMPYPPANAGSLSFQSSEGFKINYNSAYVFDEKKNVRYSFGRIFAHNLGELGWFDSESTLVLIDEYGNLYYSKEIQSKSIGKKTISLERIDRKNVNLGNIQKFIRETTYSI